MIPIRRLISGTSSKLTNFTALFSVSQVRFQTEQVAIPTDQPIPGLKFPCIEKQVERSLDGGPEPMYDTIVSGFELFHQKSPFKFHYGGVIPELKIAYETWGTLNQEKSNAILIHTGLSASSHARSHAKNQNPGWWEKFIGPGRSIDTNKYFVICTNVLGGCYGSSGPSTINPLTRKRYATTFPIMTVPDMIHSQVALLDHLGISKLWASVGSSLGGMQSLTLAAFYPERVNRLVSISAAARSIPYSIATRYTQRRILMSDPNWKNGHYYDSIFPHIGMKLSRELATISYRSGPEWENRFGRRRATTGTPSLCPDFLIEQYLDYQGERFCLIYDPNSLLYISKAMDLFDLSLPKDEKDPNSEMDLAKGLARIKCSSLIMGVKTDLLFPVFQQRELANILKQTGNQNVRYYELDADYGHDTFLIDIDTIGSAIKSHLEHHDTVFT